MLDYIYGFSTSKHTLLCLNTFTMWTHLRYILLDNILSHMIYIYIYIYMILHLVKQVKMASCTLGGSTEVHLRPLRQIVLMYT